MGRQRDLLTSKLPLRNVQCEISGVLGTYVDITERKRAEESLREQKEELQHWYEATLGREGRILELKQEVSALLSKAELQPRYLCSTEGPD